jgi:YegS/Rv2252/BmrU family lipid kinase
MRRDNVAEFFMPGKSKIAIIVNAHSAGGKTTDRWPGIESALKARLGPVETRFTEAKEGGAGVARQLLREGYDYIVAAGGDGTINEVANAFLENDQPVHAGARLGILPLGTGGDFRRTLGIGPGISEIIETLATGTILRMDVGKSSFCGHDGRPQMRYFVNVASFGMGGEVAARSQNAMRALGGTTAFLWATFTTFLAYRGKRVRLALDGQNLPSPLLVTNVAVGNGEYQGGGMHPCPKALLTDGMLEVTVIDRLGMFELARDIRMLYSEDVYRHPKVHHFRARRVAAEADEATQLEVDGEPLGRLPFEATILPNRISVVVPKESPLASGNRAPGV